MKRKVTFVLAAILVLAVGAMGGNAYAETITVAGTGASQQMLRAVAKTFMEKNPGMTVKVPDSIGSGGGVKAAGTGEVVLGRVARKIKEKEKSYGLKYLVFAKMPVVFAANPSVTGVSNLTISQTVDIFGGKTKNWKVLGGPDARIRVVTRYEGDSTLDILKVTLTGWADLKVTDKSKSAETDQDNGKLLEGTPNTVGFATLDIANTAGLNVFSLDGTAPQARNYPISIEFALVYKPEELVGTTRKFVDYLFSEDATSAIKMAGGVPVPK